MSKPESGPMDEGEVLRALLWEPPIPPKRGPKPTFTLEQVVQVAIDLADAEGLAAVTMQRVAEALGVTKMAIYRYVPGKAELVALMVDIGIGKPARSHKTKPDWRAGLSAWARQLFVRMRKHPWSLEATLGVRVMGPNELAWLEQALAALTDTGLDGAEMLDVVVTLVGHVRNLAQQLAAIAADKPEHALEHSLLAVLQGREESFPALTAALKRGNTRGRRDQALDFGLDRILDGVAVLIERRA